MMRKCAYSLAGAIVLSMAANAASAATISLTPASTDATVGDAIVLDVFLDFTADGGTVGGGLNINFDTTKFTVNAGSFVFDSTLSSNAAFSLSQPEVTDTGLKKIGIANFNGFGTSAVVHLGTLSLTALEAGDFSFNLSDDSAEAPPNGGRFFSADINNPNPLDVTYSGALVSVQAAAPVPLPATLPLFIGAVATMAARTRRRGMRRTG